MEEYGRKTPNLKVVYPNLSVFGSQVMSQVQRSTRCLMVLDYELCLSGSFCNLMSLDRTRFYP